MGRPTSYKEEYDQAIIDYFSIPLYEEIEIPHFKGGEVSWIEKKLRANRLPTFHGFANSIGLTDTATIVNWCRNFPSFLSAYTRAKELQKYFIAENALQGAYNANFAQFMLVNISDWRIKQVEEIDQKQVNITVMLPPNEREQLNKLPKKPIIEIQAETIKETE